MSALFSSSFIRWPFAIGTTDLMACLHAFGDLRVARFL